MPSRNAIFHYFFSKNILFLSDMPHGAVIGNGSFGAIVDRRSRIVWCCLDGFGSDPVFNSLLNNDSDEGGFFDVSIENLAKTEQKYIPNTAVQVTTLVSHSGDVLQVKDFSPRFYSHGSEMGCATYRPCQLYRVVTRIRGDPIATIRVRPSFEYNSAEGYQTRGSHHIRYCGTSGTVRLSTNAPIQLLMDESPFLIHETIYLVFGQDESFTHDIVHTCKEYEERTIRYWKQWSMTLSVPVDYQDILIRSAITLQLLQSEEMGGILTSLTLGIPLGSDLPPTRDERTFQLLDTCLAIPTLRQMGLSTLTKRFLGFLKSIAFQHDCPQAVYDHLGHSTCPGLELSSMAGYLGIGPTVAGGISENPSGDIGMLGLLVTALSSGFFDARLKDLCSPKLFERMETFGEMALKGFADMVEGRGCVTLSARSGSTISSSRYFEDDPLFLSLPDSERSGVATPGHRRQLSGHCINTFQSILCWAGVDRLARVAEHNHWMEKSRVWVVHAKNIRDLILAQAVHPHRGILTSTWGGEVASPSLLRVAEIGFLSASDPLFAATVSAFETDAFMTCFSKTPVENRSKDWASLVPSTPFQTSTLLWYAEALRAMGRETDARDLFNAICASSNETGLVSESIDLKDGRHWGNFPHAPTLIGILRVGSRLSRDWRSV